MGRRGREWMGEGVLVKAEMRVSVGRLLNGHRVEVYECTELAYIY